MVSNYVDKSGLPSRHVTEGPERAPHRSYLYAMGATEYGSGVIGEYAQLVGPARFGALTNPGAKGEKEQYADI